MRRRFEELRLAVVFLTRLPAGRLKDPIPELSAARWAFPLVGLAVGAITAAVFWVLTVMGMAPMLAAVLALAAQALTTGALHQDGLADVADGLGGGRDRAHALEIMRDSRIGSYGALALVLTTAAWIVALAEVGQAWPLLALAVASRLAMLAVLVELPSARAEGLGQSASARCRPYAPGLIVAVACLLPLGWAGAWAAAAMALMTLLLANRALKRIGGQTGDVCGAAQILSETAGLVALCLS
ncbi:adenosylcobinamide-GDP ribazoletransferase [Sagittula salina]|nr:adenosylcobinamide-GDP ribazoletransferase [Sagittula salina]